MIAGPMYAPRTSPAAEIAAQSCPKSGSGTIFHAPCPRSYSPNEHRAQANDPPATRNFA